MQTIALCLRRVTVALIWAVFAVSTPGYAQDDTSSELVTALQLASDISTPEKELILVLIPLTGEELSELAAVWQGHVRAAIEKASLTNLALQNAGKGEQTEFRKQLEQEQLAFGHAVEKYRRVLSEWRAKGGSEEDLDPHEDYATALTTGSLQTADPRTLFNLTVAWLLDKDGGLGLLMRGAILVLVIWGLMFVARFSRRITMRALDRVERISRLLKTFVATAVYWFVFIIGILIVLGLFGVNVTPLFALVGGLSFILGFALQDTLGNLASGLMIMILKPFDTGDYIEVSGVSGIVDEMSVVSTQIRTFDNQIIVVPNSKIWGDIITNVSASAERRVDLVFGIGYGDDTAQAIKALKQLVSQHSLCLATPAPEIFVGELGDSSVNIFCRPWVKSADYWTVYWDLTGQAKERFDAEGITIPFPQRDVHIIPAESPAEEASS